MDTDPSEAIPPPDDPQVSGQTPAPTPSLVPTPAPALLWTAAACTAGAALVHAAAAGTHSDDTALVWTFALTAVVQGAVAAWLVTRPGRAAVAATVVTGLVAVAAWTASRTVGLPVIDSLSAREPVGTQDLTAAALAGTAVVAAAVACAPAVARGAHRAAGAFAVIPALALLPTMIGVTAAHSHGEGSGHDHTHTADAGHDDTAGHDHTADHDHTENAASLADDPIFAGADTSGIDEAQLEAAKSLVVDTRTAVPARFDDVASVEAAGYRSIGDGRRPGSFRHYINAAYMADGQVLDPERPESLVFRNDGDTMTLVSAMYIAEPGTALDEAPEVAGTLTTWHDHTNLCWAPGTNTLAGIVLNGRCTPGGEQRDTPPMLHVWLEDQPCGPFAGLEGHGATAGAQGCATHEHGGGS